MKLRFFGLWLVVCGITLLIFPVVSAAAPNKSLIAAGWGHTLAIQKDGTLWAWGWNDDGQLGLGDRFINRYSPIRVGKDTSWVAVAAGRNHSLALKADGSLWTWGDNELLIWTIFPGKSQQTASDSKPHCPNHFCSPSIVIRY